MLATAQQAYEAALAQESDAAVSPNIRALHEQACLHLHHVYATCVCASLSFPSVVIRPAANTGSSNSVASKVLTF